MCKIRDIIIINKYKNMGDTIGRHSFIVLDDVNGEIQGMPYDMACNVLSSFKDEKQRRRKLSYPGNYPISVEDLDVPGGNQREGFVKADQLFYFKKDKISYKVIGSITEDAFNALVDFINNSTFDIIHITDNL